MLVLSPIFEADLQPEQHAYRAGRSALDATQRVHRLVNSGYPEIVDGGLSKLLRGDSARGTAAVGGARTTGACCGGSSDGWKWPLKRTTGRVASVARTGCVARGSDLAVTQQCLHAAVHPRAEDAGPRPAVRRGNRQLRGRLRNPRAGTGGRDAVGGRVDDGAAAVAGQRAEDPLLARAGGADGVPRVSRRTQLRPAHGSVRSVCRKIGALTVARQGWCPRRRWWNAGIDCCSGGRTTPVWSRRDRPTPPSTRTRASGCASDCVRSTR